MSAIVVNTEPAYVPEGSYRKLSRAQLCSLSETHSKTDLTSYGGIEGVAGGLGSNLRGGLPQVEVDTGFVARKIEYGTNVMPAPKLKTIFEHFWDAIKDTTIIILCCAAVLSIILQSVFEDPKTGWYEGVAILSAVVIVTFVTSGNNYSQDKQFRNLNQTEKNKTVKVIRGGEKVQCYLFDIVVGDILLLEKGDMIPADGLAYEVFNMMVDESAMTGESDMIEKTPNDPFLMSGCLVSDGMGRMLVTSTGEDSAWGKALAKLSQENEETPLQEKLEELAGQIGKVGLTFAVLTFCALTLFWALNNYYFTPIDFEWANLVALLDFFIIAVTIVVVAIPEGLPLAVTISLAYSMKKMMQDNNLVRRLQACETMGGATNICSDKTGTLTTNQMTVLDGWVAGCRFTRGQLPATLPLNSSVQSIIGSAVAVNSTAYLQRKGGQTFQVGNKTECAMLGFIEGFGFDYEILRSQAQVHKIFSFTSERKRMSTIITFNKQRDVLGGPTTEFRVFTKGASEIVLGLCTQYLCDDGTVRPIERAFMTQLQELIDQMASSGLRTICIGYRDFSEDNGTWDQAPPESDLTCIAILGIKDPVRLEVPQAVATCQRAGIFVRMVTGDNLATAKAIARDCGILTGDGIAMEGSEFRDLPEERVFQILPKLQVLARSSPTDKYRLVELLKEAGEVVAVTGDGTNDAPALKKAHVGLAMGISGTDVAKEASDIIILDDDFSSIVAAVMWGRCVFDNIRKFLQFQLTVNVVALLTAFLAAVTDHGLPLKTIQLLWVNLIMDTLAALALGTETPTRDLLDRKPYGSKESLLSPIMIRNIAVQALFQLSVLLSLLYAGPVVLGLPKPQLIDDVLGDISSLPIETIVFNTFVWLQLFNEINARLVSNKMNPFAGIHRNPIYGSVFVVTIVLQFLIVQFGGSFVETTPLNPAHWAICIFLGFLSIPVGFLTRLIPIDRWLKRNAERNAESNAENKPLLRRSKN